MNGGIHFFDEPITVDDYLYSLDEEEPEIFSNWELVPEMYKSLEYLLKMLIIFTIVFTLIMNLSVIGVITPEIFLVLPILAFLSIFRKTTYIISDNKIAKIYTLPFIRVDAVEADLDYIESDENTVTGNRVITTKEPAFGIQLEELKEYEHYYNTEIYIRNNELLEKLNKIMSVNKI